VLRSEKRRNLKTKTVPLWLMIVLVLISTVGTAYALTIIALQIERINIWEGQYQDTDFTITAFKTRLIGKNRVWIRITIKNNDVNVHSANVTVQLLDSSGNLINIGGQDMEQYALTGDVAGGDTWTHLFRFYATDLVSQYNSPFIIIEQQS